MADLPADPRRVTVDPDASRWQRLRTLFDLAADQSPIEWPATLAREAAGEPALQEEVLALLRAFQDDQLHLDEPRFDLESDADGAHRVGTTVAQYRLVRLLGHGGMGTVYEGVRADGEYEQRVAVKFVRDMPGGGDLTGRFRRERRILAALEHRNIARIIDGGQTDAGDPFFVMEFVDGVPITTWCDERHLHITDRLRLFLQACAAVEHAHGKFAVHRDLKPANILVTTDGSVKLLDFGVAGLLGPAATDDLVTVSTSRALTPEYASPEQLRDEPASAASDVYSLGIVLYELLCGRRPFVLPHRTPIAALRAIEGEPPRPSSVVSDATALARGESTALRLGRKLRGELDNVVGRAIRADVAQRYPSVEQLSADVRRYLNGLPVLAQPDSVRYRLAKFVARHRITVAAGTLLLLTIIGSALVVFTQARRAVAEYRWDLSVNAAANLDDLGNMYLAGGNLRRADTLQAGAVRLCRTPHAGRDVPLVCARAFFDLGLTRLWRGDPPGAERLIREALAAVRDAPGPMEAVVGRGLVGLAQARDAQGDLAGAEQNYREAARLFHAGHADLSQERIDALGWYAITLERQHRYVEADSLVRLELALVNDVNASVVWLHIAAIESAQGRLEQARSDMVRAADTHRIALDTTALYYEIINRAEVEYQLAIGRATEAEAQLRRVIDVVSRNYPSNDPRLAELQVDLGRALIAQHRDAAAVPVLTHAVATLRTGFGATHPQTVAAQQELAAAIAASSAH